MATIGPDVHVLNLIAGADLTSLQYWPVTTSSSDFKVIQASGASAPVPIGILLNDPSSGQAAQVAVFGNVPAQVNPTTAIAVGDFLTTDASFMLTYAATASAQYFAQALQAAATGAGCPIIEVMWWGNHGYVGDNTP